jgi:predicted DNA-binding transcriptional regulator AlpA
MSEKYMTAPEVADHCRVSVWTIYARVKAGMPHGRIGNRLLFDVAEVNAWIRNHAQVQPQWVRLCRWAPRPDTKTPPD